MTFGERVTGAMKLDAHAFEDVERDPAAIGQAVGVIVLSALASGIGTIYAEGSPGLFGGLIGSLLGYLVWAGIIWIVGTKLMPDPGTQADFPQTFRTVAFAASPGLFHVLGVIGILPLIGGLLAGLIRMAITIWTIAAMVVAVRQVLDYSTTGKAIVVVIVGFIAYLLVMAIVMIPIFGARLMFG